MKKVVLIGGGTGSFVVLSGLKQYPCELSAVVTMMDSGGSTGRLRDQFGILPPGDIRQCLVALSGASELWRSLFLYRFDGGDLDGHNFGNIFLAALEKTLPNYQEVIDTAAYILNIKGSVLPVTFDRTHICAEYEDGEIIETEGLIDIAAHKTSRIVKMYVKPKANANKKALVAISSADYLLMGPGDLYTGLVPNLVIGGMKKAIQSSKAPIIYTPNLFTKRGQTTSYAVSDHVRDVEHYCGRSIDTILINQGLITSNIIEYYEKYDEMIVRDDMGDDPRVIRRNLVSQHKVQKVKGDKIARSILRHDSDKLAHALWNCIQ